MLILASTSPYRKALMDRLGLPFAAVRPACDEEALKDPRWTPAETARRLARAKAESLRAAHPQDLIIGSDQVCALGDEILHKPGTPERAVEHLLRLQGRSHALLTAMTVVGPGVDTEYLDTTTLVMRSLSRDALTRYVAADHPVDCAGAYKLELRGITLFERIDTVDQTAIIGLPLMALTRILAAAGHPLP